MIEEAVKAEKVPSAVEQVVGQLEYNLACMEGRIIDRPTKKAVTLRIPEERYAVLVKLAETYKESPTSLGQDLLSAAILDARKAAGIDYPSIEEEKRLLEKPIEEEAE